MTTDLSISRGSIESAKKALENDLKAVVSDAGKLLNEVGNYTVEEFAAARSRIEARYDNARISLHNARLLATDRAKNAADATQQYVCDNPWKTIGVVAGVVLIMAALNKRH
ncbi:MAG: DUF883 family protein [Azonexus sp.]|nr:DUF883 family protein [Azonexus sp.]MDP3638015.1 DUF883 family protein [Azonexus sp.]MDZ4313468.1 DUF883 family protein [Azonexus sp.]